MIPFTSNLIERSKAIVLERYPDTDFTNMVNEDIIKISKRVQDLKRKEKRKQREYYQIF